MTTFGTMIKRRTNDFAGDNDARNTGRCMVTHVAGIAAETVSNVSHGSGTTGVALRPAGLMDFPIALQSWL